MAKGGGWDIVVDVCAPRNREVRFFPLHKTLRGTVRMSEIASDKPNGALLQVDMEIPGMRLYVDLDAKHVRIVDRMTLPENKEKDRKLRAILKQEQYVNYEFKNYEGDYDTSIPDSEWPTWLWHIRNLVDADRFQFVSGERALPTREAILKMCEGRRAVLLGESCGVRPIDKDRPFWRLDAKDAAEYAQVPT